MSTSKKIIILSPAHPLRGGIAASSERLAKELQDMGHQLEICSFSLQYPNFLFPGKTQFTDDPPPPHLKIHTKINSVNPFNWITTGLWLKKQQADLIIVRYWLPFMGPSLGFISRIAKTANTKIISLADNIIPHETRLGDRIFTKWFVESMDGFVVMSGSVGEDVRIFNKKKEVHFAPHPVYDNYGKALSRKEAINKLALNEDLTYILFFGFIRDYKGLDLLLEAFAKVHNNHEKARLLIAGEFYGNEEKYQQLIDRLEIRDKIILQSDFISDVDVKYYFCAADLVAQTYKSATQSGISQIAYHFEKPMLVTNVGGMPEIVEDGKAGYVCHPTAEDIAIALEDYLANTAKKSILEAGVKENKHLFSWQRLANEFLNFLK